MTGDQVYRIMHRVSKFLEEESGGSIVLDDNMSCGDGVTIEVPGRGAQFIIGVKGLENNHFPMSNYKAMVPFVALMHEVCGHGGQLKYEFSKDTDLSRVLALNKYACYSSGLYYDGTARPGVFTKQYSRQPHEIAAQYMGLKAAQAYLPRVLKEMPLLTSKIFGRVETDDDIARRADEMLLNYVNHRVQAGSEFISRRKPYKHISEVYNDFECKFLDCYDAHREYDHTADPASPIGHQRRLYDDLSKRGIYNYGLSEEQAAWVNKSMSGVHQDIMMCAVFLADDPSEAQLLRKPVFDEFYLPLDESFCEKSPWRPVVTGPSPMERMKNMVHEIDRKNKVAQQGLDGPG